MISDLVHLGLNTTRRTGLIHEADRERLTRIDRHPRNPAHRRGRARIACRGGWITGVVAAALLSTPVAPAAAKPEDPPKPQPSGTIVRRIEIPVPVDDTTTEAIQMAVAAALAAALAAGTTRVRIRNSRRGGTGSGLIDITDTVQHQA
jgi:hypothetical protein